MLKWASRWALTALIENPTMNTPNRRQLFGAGALCFATPLSRKQTPEVGQRHLRLVLLRHAEKAADDPQDPSLSAEGEERARALDQLLSAIPSGVLYSTPFRRTNATLAPLAKRWDVTPKEYNASKLPELIAELCTIAPTDLIVVVGHSNTTPSLAQALGMALSDLDPRGNFHEQHYDRLLFLTAVPEAATASLTAVSTLELRYGLARS